jgi:hypothetical protein
MKCRSVSSSAILMVIDLPLETSTVAFTLCSVIGDSNIPIAIIDDVNKGVSSTIFKKQKLPVAYEALKKSGFNFTSYD